MMKFAIDIPKGKLVMAQAIVMKTLGISDLIIETKRFPWIFDIRCDNYGKICVRQASVRGNEKMETYRFALDHRSNKRYHKVENDTYFLLAFSRDFKNIENVYVIPSKYIIENNKETINIYRNATVSKYDRFKVDHGSYLNAFDSLVKYIGDATIIDTNYLKDWLKVK